MNSATVAWRFASLSCICVAVKSDMGFFAFLVYLAVAAFCWENANDLFDDGRNLTKEEPKP